MLTRRGFASCALCVVTGFTATRAEAQNAPAGLKRTIITRTDGPIQGYETVNARVDLDAGALVARHTHPGIESSYVVDGALELSVDGQGTHTFKAGDGFQVPPQVPLAARAATSPRFSRSPMSSRKASLSPLRLEARASLNAKPMSLPALPFAGTSAH